MSGLGHINANYAHTSNCLSTQNNFNFSQGSSAGIHTGNSIETLKVSPYTSDNINDKIFAESEDENHERIQVKRSQSADNYFAVFYACIPWHTSNYVKKRLPVDGKQFAYTSSNRCILFQVFRV